MSIALTCTVLSHVFRELANRGISVACGNAGRASHQARLDILLLSASGYAFRGPWLKGFMGEVGIGPTAEMGTLGICRSMWMDHDLREDITG